NRRWRCPGFLTCRQLNTAKTDRAGVRFTALEEHQMMAPGAEAGQRRGRDRFSFPDFDDRVRAVHLRVEKALAFGVIEEQAERVTLEVEADSAGLPDDHRRIRIGKIKAALISETRVRRGNSQRPAAGWQFRRGWMRLGILRRGWAGREGAGIEHQQRENEAEAVNPGHFHLNGRINTPVSTASKPRTSARYKPATSVTRC